LAGLPSDSRLIVRTTGSRRREAAVQVLFNYECRCGAPFVICAAPAAGSADGWRRNARRVARGLGRGFVDATAETFRCPSCGTIHERQTAERRAA
jgi:hypothetical protein